MNMEEVLAANYKATTEFNPDQVAEANTLSSGLQVDPRLVFEDIGLARDAAQQPNWTEYVRRAPGSAQYLSDPANMAVSRDDTQGLLSIEDVFRARNPQTLTKEKESSWTLPEADWAQGHSGEIPAADFEGAPADLNALDSLLWQLGNAGKATVIGKRVAAIGNQVADGNLSAPEAFTMLNDLYKVPEPTTWMDKYIARNLMQFIDQRIQPATDPAVLTQALAMGTATGGATAWATAAAGPMAPALMPFTVTAAATAGVIASYTTSVLDSMRRAERGQAMIEYLQQGIPAERAAIGAEIYSLFATGTEAAGLGFLYTSAVKMGVTGEAFKSALKGFIGKGLKDPRIVSTIGKLTGLWAAGAIEEAGTEGIQQAGQDLIGEWQKYLANQADPTLGLKYKTPREIIGNTAEAFSTTVFPAMLMTGTSFARSTTKALKAHNEAQVFAEHHQTLNDAVQGSLTKQRSPEKMEAVLGVMGLKEIGYLSPEGAETLLKTLSEEEARALSSRLGINYEKTLFDIQEGREVPLKMATLHAQLSKEEFAAILPDLRPASGELSQREAIEQGPAEEVARQADILIEENDAFHKLVADPLLATTEWRDTPLQVNGETQLAGEVVDHLNERTSELEKLVECLR